MMTTPGSGDATAVPQYSEADLQLALGVVSQDLTESVMHIVTLSDEELLAIEGIQHRQLTALPWADENLRTKEERAVATAAATRSLIARGLVTTTSVKDPRLPEQAGPEDEIAPALRGTVVARRSSDWVIVADRTTSQGTATAVFYVFDLEGGQRVLFEVFDEMGRHLFFVLSVADLAEQFWLWIDPAQEIGDEDGEIEEHPAASFSSSEKARALAEGRAATAVVVRARDEETAPAFSLFAQPGRVELMESDGEGEDAVVRLGAISRQRLFELVTSLVETLDDDA